MIITLLNVFVFFMELDLHCISNLLLLENRNFPGIFLKVLYQKPSIIGLASIDGL